MTWINDTKSKARLSAKFTAGLIISAALVLGTIAAPALAAPDHAGWGDHDNHRGNHRQGWNRDHYRAPPVVYGGYYRGGYGYYPPPVVYGPNIGVSVPGISVGIW
jgi:hypothetical protein